MKRTILIALLAIGLIAGTAVAHQGPFQKGGGDPSKQVTAEKLAKVEKEYKAAKAAFEKKPKDAKLKKAYVDATVSLGLGSMYSASLPTNKKYKLALTYFREAMKVDPKNKIAKENHDIIVSIYKQLGKEVPK